MTDRLPATNTPVAEALIERFKARTATVGVVGLGYVGLPLVCRFAEAGFKTIGFDIDSQKVEALGKGDSYIGTVPHGRVADALKKGFHPTADYSLAAKADALIICVPTPLSKTREPDLQYIVGTMDSLLPHLHPGQLLSLESTSYPGTTEEEVRARTEAKGLKTGEDFFIVFSPEREDPGNEKFSTRNIPKIVGGATPACLEVGVALYGQAIDRVVPVSSTRVAEMAKLLENIHRAVNIGLVNEMKVVADKMGIDIHEVIRAAATKPFGFVAYTPGPGLGGHCIPIDPFYLTWKAREYGFYTEFIELAGKVNESMPYYCRSLVSQALNHSRQRSLSGSRILVLGVAYKPDISDMRESPAVKLIGLLENAGAEVAYHDPHVPEFTENGIALYSVPLAPSEYDCVVIVTDHASIDYEQLVEDAHLVVDLRNATGSNGRLSDKVWHL